MATFPSKVNYATGDILTATNMNDVGGAINLLQSAQFSAGKNVIINGDFGVWQRGTSFSNPANEAYLADRFNIVYDGSGSTRTISQQAQTPNAISGYDYPYFFRFAQTVAGSGGTYVGMNQRIEGVQTFAANTVTLSFWAKADATRTLTPSITQNFGSGGSTAVATSGTGITLTTSWARYTQTFSIPSISGKTVGTSSYLQLYFGLAANTVQTIDLFGVQLEAASTASNFQTATGTKQGELAACQRYYWRNMASNTYSLMGTGTARSTTSGDVYIQFPIPMRTAPTSLDSSTLGFFIGNIAGSFQAGSGFASNALQNGTNGALINGTVASGFTANQAIYLTANNSTAAYIGFSAEL